MKEFVVLLKLFINMEEIVLVFVEIGFNILKELGVDYIVFVENLEIGGIFFFLDIEVFKYEYKIFKVN